MIHGPELWSSSSCLITGNLIAWGTTLLHFSISVSGCGHFGKPTPPKYPNNISDSDAQLKLMVTVLGGLSVCAVCDIWRHCCFPAWIAGLTPDLFFSAVNKLLMTLILALVEIEVTDNSHVYIMLFTHYSIFLRHFTLQLKNLC